MSEYSYNKKDIIQDKLFEDLDKLNNAWDNNQFRKNNNFSHFIKNIYGMIENRTIYRILQIICSYLLTTLGCIICIYCVFTSLDNLNYYFLLGVFSFLLTLNFLIKMFDVSRVCPICGENHALVIKNVSKNTISQNQYNDDENIYEVSTYKNTRNIACKYCNYSENIEDIESEEDFIGLTELGKQRELQREQERIAQEQLKQQELQKQQMQDMLDENRKNIENQQRQAEKQQWEFQYNQRKEQERQRQLKYQQEAEEQWQRRQEEREREKEIERQKNETIASAVQNGNFVNVYNLNGHLLFTRSGLLKGWTNSTVSVKNNGFVNTYNSKGHLLHTRTET